MRHWFLAVAMVSATAANAKDIDLRVRTDAQGEYDVAFCARPSPAGGGLPGHMFVAFSKMTADGKRTFVAVGHTVGAGTGAVSAAWSYFGAPVNGLLKEEMYTSVRQQCLNTRVNKEVFDKAFQRTVSPLAALGITSSQDVVLQQYKLGEQDCMAYASSVADDLKPVGLKVPPRGAAELPMAYIKRLIETN